MTGSRGFWTRIAAFALVGVLLGALAAFLVRAGGDSGPGEADAPASSATLAALATDRPSSAPPTQPSAGDAPTAQPAAEPTAAGSKRTSLAAFVKHVTAAIKDGQALIEPLQQAAQAFDIKATKGAASDISDWAQTERTWLDRHPPRACYAAVHAEYGNGVDDFGQAAKITKRFADAFPFADYGDLQRAVDLATAGSASMESVVDQLNSVRC